MSMKKLLALLLTLCMAGGAIPVSAAEETPQPIPNWAYGVLADGYAMGLFGDEIYTQHSQTITKEQLASLTQVVGDKLALLEMDQRGADETALVIDTTRGGVVNALYQEAAAYAFPGVEEGPEAFMTSVGALAGDGSGLNLDRSCTYLEAVTMADSLVLNLYDQQNAGSLGLLWKAEGNGNTLYLLGSIHTDRNHVYPFHKQLRDIILNADQVSFELDFNDQAGLAEFAAMQVYSDGTTLADHISPELYQVVVNTASTLGMDEGTVSQYKAWALASSLMMVLDPNTMDESTKSALTAVLGEEALTQDGQAAVEEGVEQISLWMDQWKTRDVEGFAESYPKDEIINGADELESKLFTGRDPGMITYAANYLEQEGSHNGLLVVGAGHMIGSGGIVQGLKDLGYTVEVVPNP